MIRSYLIKKDGETYDMGEAIWCIVGTRHYFPKYDSFEIQFRSEAIPDGISAAKDYIKGINSIGLPIELIQETENRWRVKMDLSFYSTYTKVLTVLTIFRAVFSKYSTRGILQKYVEFKPLFPEFNFLQLYFLSYYHTSEYIIGSLDELHSITANYVVPVSLEKFKNQFSTATKVHNVFMNPSNGQIRRLVQYPETNREELIKIFTDE